MAASRPKAIQWSTPPIHCATDMPASQPTTGMKNWKKPKCQARRTVMRGPTTVAFNPTPMETAKASMARPIATPRRARRLTERDVSADSCQGEGTPCGSRRQTADVRTAAARR